MSEEKAAAPDNAAETDKLVTAKTAASITTADKPAATKPSKLEETKAKNKKALADALAKAQAVKLVQPPSLPPVIKARTAKAAKSGKKPKLVRHAFSMPEVEYAQIVALKKRIASLGGNVKRSELMRGGLSLLAALGDAELALVMTTFGRLKSKRTTKKA